MEKKIDLRSWEKVSLLEGKKIGKIEIGRNDGFDRHWPVKTRTRVGGFQPRKGSGTVCAIASGLKRLAQFDKGTRAGYGKDTCQKR